MAITLETIAAPGATPIANNSASAKSFANDYYKLMDPGLSDRQRKAIIIDGMMYTLALTGANYKFLHAALIQDAAVYTAGISNPINIWAALAATTAGAANTGAGMSLDVRALMSEMRDIVELPEPTQDKIIAFLAAQLGI